jgi:hypothetical protein
MAQNRIVVDRFRFATFADYRKAVATASWWSPSTSELVRLVEIEFRGNVECPDEQIGYPQHWDL